MAEIHVLEQEQPPFYTVRSLARRLSVTERTVENILSRGELPSYRFGTARRIDPDDVDSYLASKREGRKAA